MELSPIPGDGRVAVVTDSSVLVVGAMVVGPEFSAVAALCAGIVLGRPRLIRRSITLLTLGFLLAIAAVVEPQSLGIVAHLGDAIPTGNRLELFLGAAIGAITFSGSVIAFAKLSGRMSGSPILLPARHVINLGTLAAIIVLTALFAPGEAIAGLAALG